MQEDFTSIDLPSGLKPYGVDDFQIRPFDVMQVKKLMSLGEGGVNDKLYDIVGPSTKGVPIRQLTVGDFWFILHWIRFNTFHHHPLRVPWTCPHCRHDNNSVITKELIKTIDLDDSYIHGQMSIKLPDQEERIKFRLQVVSDEDVARKQTTEYLRKARKLKNASKVVLEDGELWNGILAQLIEPNGGTFDERYALINDTFSPDDLFTLQSIGDVFAHGIDNVVSLKCSQITCQEEVDVQYVMNLRNFFPSTSDRSSIEASRSAIFSDSDAGDSGGDAVSDESTRSPGAENE